MSERTEDEVWGTANIIGRERDDLARARAELTRLRAELDTAHRERDERDKIGSGSAAKPVQGQVEAAGDTAFRAAPERDRISELEFLCSGYRKTVVSQQRQISDAHRERDEMRERCEGLERDAKLSADIMLSMDWERESLKTRLAVLESALMEIRSWTEDPDAPFRNVRDAGEVAHRALTPTATEGGG